MVAVNLFYLIAAFVFLAHGRGLLIPLVLARESRDTICADRREVLVLAWLYGGWTLSTLELFYDAQSLMAFVIAAAVTTVATRTTLDYVQLLRWVDQVCCEGRDMRRSGAAPPLF
jgi:hypothetical protein